MKEKIKKDRKLLFLFFLLWIAMKAILLQVSREPSMIRTAIGIVGLIILAISAIYVYKMYKWYNSPKAPALVMAIIYFVFDFIFPLVSILIGAGIIWESRKLLKNNS